MNKQQLVNFYFEKLNNTQDLSLEEMNLIVQDSLTKKDTCLKLQVYLDNNRLSYNNQMNVVTCLTPNFVDFCVSPQSHYIPLKLAENGLTEVKLQII